MKRLKRIVAAVLLLTALSALAVWWLFRGTPGFYHAYQWTEEQRARYSQQALDKLAAPQNMAAAARARASAEARGQVVAASAAPTSVTVRFDEAELNAFLAHWSRAFRAQYERSITDPAIFLRDGHIILAARWRDLGTLASLHFAAGITADGELELRLVKRMGGKLPLPSAVTRHGEQVLRNAVARSLPAWQAAANIDATCTANLSAVKAATGKLMLSAMDNRPASAVLFVPLLDNSHAVAVRLTQLEIADGSISLTVEVLPPAQRQALQAKIREPYIPPGPRP